jgi:ribosomal protein L11 methyltransferase
MVRKTAVQVIYVQNYCIFATMANRNYVNVSISVLEEDYESAYAVLTDYNFIGMEEKLDEVILTFEENEWSEEVKLKLQQELSEMLPSAKITNTQILTERNWQEEWEKNVEPVQISDNLVITPEWKSDGFECKYKIFINPKMSFGTGQHSTTKLMATMLEQELNTKLYSEDAVFVDAGTGTGVLAIIAAEMGIHNVYAFDNDDWSYENAVENVVLNNVQQYVKVSQSNVADYNFPESDCILANMFLNVIKASLPQFHDSLKRKNGTLFVSGILVFDRDDMLEAALNAGFVLDTEMQEQEWCCFKFRLQ